MDGSSLKVHTGFISHPALQLLAGQVVALAILDEHGAGLNKAEGHVSFHAFLPEGLDPIEIAGAGTIVVFAAADDLLDLPGGKVLPDTHRSDEGRAHNTLVLEGQAEQNRNALIGTALVFTGDVEKDVVPTGAPVRRQALPHPLRPLCEQEKHHIAALAHDVPRLNPPRVGFFQEEIRGHADPDLLTKRPQRVRECLPPDWGSGWDNIFFNVTCENQRRADERIPILFELPFKHKGIMCAPFIGSVSIRQYLAAGQIEQVICGGENYDGARPCNFDWVKSLRQECVEANVTFCFIETGTVFIKDGKRYHLPSKQLQSRMAYKSGMNFQGRPIRFDLVDDWGYPIPQEDLYVPHFRANCETCGSKLICNGCSDCGKCL